MTLKPNKKNRDFLNRKISISASMILVAAFISLFIYTGVLAAVTLVYFRAIPGDGEVVLLWETATELDNAGFYINRSNQENGAYQRINQTIIAPRGDGLTGAVYEFADTNVINGTTYWYRLESLDFGQQSQYYNPVSAVPGVELTPTPTQATNATSTLQPNQGVSVIRTPTPTSAGVDTATSVFTGSGSTQDQATQPIPINPESDIQATELVSAFEAGDSTPTLIPFPSITIQFPTQNSETGMSGGEIPVPGSSDQSDTEKGIIRFWPVGLIAALWILIIAWFLFTRKHI